MVKLFTHTDLDGIGCEILAKIAFGKDVDVTNSEVSDINKNIKEFLDNPKNNGIYDKIYITDISVNKENAERLSNRPEKVQLLDHHGTALWLNQYPWAHVRVKDKETGILTSGTELMYKNLEKEGLFKSLDNKHSEQLKQFTEAVRDYDTYRFDKMGEDGKLSRDLNDLMFIKGSIPFKNDVYNQLNIGTFPFFSEADRAMLDMSHRKLENYIKDKNENIEVFTINGYKGGLVYAEQNFSELGNKLCEMNPKLDFIAMVEPTKGFVSIRSRRDDIDVGKDIAAPLGGGGHAKSAGAPLKDEMKLLFRNALEDAVSAGAIIRNGHLMEVDFSKKSKFFNFETGQLTIPAGITAVDGIFKKNEVDLQNRLKIKSVVIESDIKEIPNGLFANCKNLEAVKFNDSLEKIEGEAFLGCERLQGISLPDSLKNIDNYAFAFCKNLSGMDMSNELYEKLISENKLGDIFMETNLDMNEFKTINRCSDITIYDSWHAGELVSGLKDDDKGYTNVVIHSAKGEVIFSKYIKTAMETYQVDTIEAIKKDGVMMTNSVKENLNRENFYQCFNNDGIKAAVQRFLPISKKDYFVEEIKSVLYRIGILSKIKSIMK